MWYEAVSLICVAALWGCTNPLIKRNTKEIVTLEANSLIKQFILELKYLFTNVDYLLPMALNQVGSLTYFITLQKADLSLSVPVANSLTFVFTAIFGWIMGERLPRLKSVTGIVLVMLGTILCCIDKFMK